MDFFVADAHCDSILDTVKHGTPLLRPYNFSDLHPQLQCVALFATDGTPGDGRAKERTNDELNAFFEQMAEYDDKIEQAVDYDGILRALNAGHHCALLTEEGGSSLGGDPERLVYLYRKGVRIFGLAWKDTDLAQSNRCLPQYDTGLTETGRKTVEVGNRLGMIFDVSHLSDRSFWDLAELSAKPIVATHSNFRSLCAQSRNLTDEMALEIKRQGGYIGLNFYPVFIDMEKERRTLDRLMDHLDHALSLGLEDVLGFGGDVDGIECYPEPVTLDRSVHDQIIERMLQRNLSETLVKKIAGENFLNYLKNNL